MFNISYKYDVIAAGWIGAGSGEGRHEGSVGDPLAPTGKMCPYGIAVPVISTLNS